MTEKTKALRDKFAIAALPACITAMFNERYAQHDTTQAARLAYQYADEMLDARKEWDDE